MTLRRTLTILLSIACVAVYGIGLLLYERNKSHLDTTEWTRHSHQVIIQAQNLHTSVERMIALQRGYLLTQNRNFYDAYFDSTTYVQNEYETLKKLTADNPSQTMRLDAIERDINEMRQLLEGALVKSSKDMARTHILQHTTKTRAIADDVRRLVTEFISSEQVILALRQEEAKERELAYFYALFAVSVLSVFVLVIANGIIWSLNTRNRTVVETLTKSEKDLFKVRERFELAMRGTSDGVFDWNADTDELYFSPRFCAMLGYYNVADFPNTSDEFRKLIHPEDIERVLAGVYACLSGQRDYSETFRIQHKDGSWRWHLARGATSAKQGEQSSRIVGAHTDITRQKTDEERLRASNKELEEFTYIASHDLRAPLVNLKGFASEIEFSFDTVKNFVLTHLPQEKSAEDQEVQNAVESDIPQAIHFIRISVTKMEKLTRAILELSRVGRRRLEFEPLHTRSIVDNCVQSLQHQINTQNISINIGALPDITGDAVAIEQVFMNIIDNAIKYLDPHRPGMIDISGIQNVSETTFHIKDNGRGIRAEDLSKVFEIFKRAGNNSTIPGEGMGMAYVQTILRRHGGSISCQSELGKGTSFYFSIPHHIEKGNPDV